MEYVSGMNLRELMQELSENHGPDWRGSDLLGVLDKNGEARDVAFSPASVADWEALEAADKLAAICWIGAESALALEHAHRAGYVHRDVKPENTIVNRFGRPMLVDFNLAVESTTSQGNSIVGGTLPYMSPEALMEMSSVVRGGNENNSDIREDNPAHDRASGERPFESMKRDDLLDIEKMQTVFADRAGTPCGISKIEPELVPVLRRAIEFNATDRYASAGEFAQTLQGAAARNEVLRMCGQLG